MQLRTLKITVTNAQGVLLDYELFMVSDQERFLAVYARTHESDDLPDAELNIAITP